MKPHPPYLVIATAAVEGLVAGCSANAERHDVVVDVAPNATASPVPSDEPSAGRPTEPRHATMPAIAKDCCRGRNDCKGLGNCKVAGKHDCRGKNDCKGLGGCQASDCSQNRDVPEKSCCAGKNECKGRGNCKVERDHACKGQNECKGKGGCKPAGC
jgi:hypothetical protein